ncbi:hypothetical protein AAFX24_19925 [Vibrio mediterranei]|uniref:hypothetical protein n=1 Tax=Vibrio mediterranei TaxID=689 RepID=UPI0038CDE675
MKYLNDAKLLEEIFVLLAENQIDVAVIRNEKGLPGRIDSTDVDIMIAKEKASISVELIDRYVKNNGYRVIWRNPLDYVYGMVIVKHVDQVIYYLKLDVFSGFRWRGMDIIDESKILKRAVNLGSIKILKPSDMDIVNLLNSVLYKKHEKVILGDVTKKSLEEIINVDLEDNCIVDGVIYRYSVLKAIKNTFGLSYYTKFSCYKLNELRIRNKLGCSLSFSGPDGSGKSTLVDVLYTLFVKTKIVNELNHFLPNGFKNLHQIKIVPKPKAVKKQSYTEPYSLKNASIPSSILRLAYYYLTFLTVWFKYIKPGLILNRVVVFDRYMYDLAIDPSRARISISRGKVSTLFQFIPQISIPFAILAKAQTLVERKNEIGINKAEEIISGINDCKDIYNLRVFENNTALNEAYEGFLDLVFIEMEQHYGDL